MDNNDNEISRLTKIFTLLSGVATTVILVGSVAAILVGSQGLFVQIFVITALAGTSVVICFFLEQNTKGKVLVASQTSRKQTLSKRAKNWLFATSAAWLVMIIMAVAGNLMTCANFSLTTCTPKPAVVSGVQTEPSITPSAVSTPTMTPYYTFKSFEINKKGKLKIYTTGETIQLFAGEKVDIKAQVETNAALSGIDFYWFTCKKGSSPASWGAGIVNFPYTAPGSVGADCIRVEFKKGGKTIQKETLFVTVP